MFVWAVSTIIPMLQSGGRERAKRRSTETKPSRASLFQRALPEVSSDLAYRTSGWVGHMATPRVKGVCDLPPGEELRQEGHKVIY